MSKSVDLDKLREMAKTGQSRPPAGSTLNQILINACAGKAGLPFKMELLALGAESWFSEIRAKNEMNALRELAKKGEPRPKLKTDLGKALVRLTRTDGKVPNYVPRNFKEELIELGASKWFQDSKRETRIEEFRAAAKAGSDHPTGRSRLLLNNFVKENPELKNELIQLSNGKWFAPTQVEKNMAALLEMAAAGFPRPDYNSPLGKALIGLISPSRHDYREGFREKLAAVGANWFKNSSNR
jgi:hypothetical protein